jgi:hypothetical protein
MKTTTVIVGMVALLVFSSLLAVTSVSATDLGLVGLLTQDLGITEKQAEGGAGAIFNMAKEELSTEDFGKVAGAVPEMDDLLSAVPKVDSLGAKAGALGSAIGGKTSLFDGSSEKLGGLAGLAGTFSQLGLKSDMVNKFVPIMLSYVESKGGESVKNILAGVLK